MDMPQPVFIGRSAELARLLREVVPPEEVAYGTRLIPVVVGPSGIGKTSLVRRLRDRIASLEGPKRMLPLLLEVIKPPRTNDDLVNIFLDAVRDSPRALQQAIEELVTGVIRRVLSKVLGPGWDKDAPILSYKVGQAARRTDPLYFISELVTSLARNAEERGYKGIIIVIDEAQNLLKGLGIEELWSFIKLLAEIQENPPGEALVQVLFVTSDYMFQQKLLQNAPSIDYIDTFYLGEMTRSDAEALYSQLCPGGHQAREALEAIGGHPALIKEACKYGLRYLCRHVRRIEEAAIVRLVETKERSGQVYDRLRDTLWRIVEKGFVRISEIVAIKQVIDSLVRANILQYACSEYVGVYRWNHDCSSDAGDYCGGGGFCGGLDIVAPSNRPALIGLHHAMAPEGEVVGALEVIRAYESICPRGAGQRSP